MSSPSRSVIQPTGLVHGHSECRDLDETIPVLSHVLALELIDRRDGEAVLKHPNTGWRLILHESGPEVPDKPERNHYGVRVSNNREVDNAYRYLLAEKEKLGLKKVVKRKERDGSYSMTAVSVAGLTIYDMCKAVDREMSIGEIRLVKKSGGKSGTFIRKE